MPEPEVDPRVVTLTSSTSGIQPAKTIFIIPQIFFDNENLSINLLNKLFTAINENNYSIACILSFYQLHKTSSQVYRSVVPINNESDEIINIEDCLYKPDATDAQKKIRLDQLSVEITTKVKSDVSKHALVGTLISLIAITKDFIAENLLPVIAKRIEVMFSIVGDSYDFDTSPFNVNRFESNIIISQLKKVREFLITHHRELFETLLNITVTDKYLDACYAQFRLMASRARLTRIANIETFLLTPVIMNEFNDTPFGNELRTLLGHITSLKQKYGNNFYFLRAFEPNALRELDMNAYPILGKVVDYLLETSGTQSNFVRSQSSTNFFGLDKGFIMTIGERIRDLCSTPNRR